MFRSFDGAYTETLTLAQARRSTMSWWPTSSRESRSPLRTAGRRSYVGPMYGYKSCKWLEAIDVSRGAPAPGYWEERGYDVDAWGWTFEWP